MTLPNNNPHHGYNALLKRALPKTLPRVVFHRLDTSKPSPRSVGDGAKSTRFGYNQDDEPPWQPEKHYTRWVQPLESELSKNVEYDMDEHDMEWLDSINQERIEQQAGSVDPELFEIIMDKLEKEWFDLQRHIPKPPSNLPIEDSKCAICDDGECENSNAIVFCDGCNLAVHQDCYGVPYIPEGQWLCRKCTVSPDRPVSCVLCPAEFGAFKQTTTGKWAHLLCAIWINETSVQNTVYMEPIDGVLSIPKSRWKLVCYLCKRKKGACIQCSKSTCYTSYHVSCARDYGLYLRLGTSQQATDNGHEGANISYCDRHSPRSHIEAEGSAEAGTRLGSEDLPTPSLIAFQRSQMNGKNRAPPHTPLSATSSGDITALSPSPNSKQSRAYNKSFTSSGPPIVPQYIFDKVWEHIKPIQVRNRKKEFVTQVCKFWSLKRESRRGAPLLKRLHLEPWTASGTSLQSSDLHKEKKLELLMHTRKDLEGVLAGTELIVKREQIKLERIKLIKDTVSSLVFPLSSKLAVALERIKHHDPKGWFLHPVTREVAPDYHLIIKSPMDWSTMARKIAANHYLTAYEFQRDFDLLVSNAITYNRVDNPVHKAAVRLKNLAAPILAELAKMDDEGSQDYSRNQLGLQLLGDEAVSQVFAFDYPLPTREELIAQRKEQQQEKEREQAAALAASQAVLPVVAGEAQATPTLGEGSTIGSGGAVPHGQSTTSDGLTTAADAPVSAMTTPISGATAPAVSTQTEDPITTLPGSPQRTNAEPPSESLAPSGISTLQNSQPQNGVDSPSQRTAEPTPALADVILTMPVPALQDPANGEPSVQAQGNMPSEQADVEPPESASAAAHEPALAAQGEVAGPNSTQRRIPEVLTSAEIAGRRQSGRRKSRALDDSPGFRAQSSTPSTRATRNNGVVLADVDQNQPTSSSRATPQLPLPVSPAADVAVSSSRRSLRSSSPKKEGSSRLQTEELPTLPEPATTSTATHSDNAEQPAGGMSVTGEAAVLEQSEEAPVSAAEEVDPVRLKEQRKMAQYAKDRAKAKAKREAEKEKKQAAKEKSEAQKAERRRLKSTKAQDPDETIESDLSEVDESFLADETAPTVTAVPSAEADNALPQPEETHEDAKFSTSEVKETKEQAAIRAEQLKRGEGWKKHRDLAKHPILSVEQEVVPDDRALNLLFETGFILPPTAKRRRTQREDVPAPAPKRAKSESKNPPEVKTAEVAQVETKVSGEPDPIAGDSDLSDLEDSEEGEANEETVQASLAESATAVVQVPAMPDSGQPDSGESDAKQQQSENKTAERASTSPSVPRESPSSHFVATPARTRAVTQKVKQILPEDETHAEQSPRDLLVGTPFQRSSVSSSRREASRSSVTPSARRSASPSKPSTSRTCDFLFHRNTAQTSVQRLAELEPALAIKNVSQLEDGEVVWARSAPREPDWPAEVYLEATQKRKIPGRVYPDKSVLHLPHDDAADVLVHWFTHVRTWSWVPIAMLHKLNVNKEFDALLQATSNLPKKGREGKQSVPIAKAYERAIAALETDDEGDDGDEKEKASPQKKSKA